MTQGYLQIAQARVWLGLRTLALKPSATYQELYITAIKLAKAVGAQ
jgi:hypothetical protein